MKTKLSLRTAILLPFLIIILALVIIFSNMIKKNYNEIALSQGTELITAMNTTAEERLMTLLDEPNLVNTLFGSLIELNQYYTSEDYSVLEPLTLGLMKDIKETLPQVSSIGYGDRNKNFLGIRRNVNDTYTLMVKDALTEDLLNIYSGEARDTEILASYENYDPTTRPWYVPVIENPSKQWSDIYINMDELNNATITSLVPILDQEGRLASVTGIDVSLNGISTFLKDIADTSSGTIYLVDESLNVIAHSTSEKLINVLETDPPSAEFSKGLESINPVIQKTSEYYQENREFGVVSIIEIEEEQYYFMRQAIDESLGLDWSIIIAISEEQLIGSVRTQFDAMKTMLILLSGFGLIVGTISLTIFISSVTRMAKEVHSINIQNLDDVFLESSRLNFKEIELLKESYNDMILELGKSFSAIKHSEEKYRILIENSDALIFSMDEEGKLLKVNTLVEQYADLTEDELIDSSFYDMFSEEETKVFWKDSIKETIKNKTSLDTVFEYLDKKNKRVIFKVRIIPVYNSENELDQLIATFVDIVELIEAQEEVKNLMKKENDKLENLVQERTQALELAMEELVQKEKLASLGSLVSGISHEINTPLGVAVSASSYLKTLALKNKNNLLDGKLRKSEFLKFVDHIEESVNIIDDNLTRAKNLIQSFKQISVNKTYEENTLFSAKEFAEATLMSLNHELKLKNITAHFVCDEDYQLFGDPGSFSQVLTNLILNSITHGYDDEQTGNIELKIHKEKGDIVIKYSDDGKGISDEILNHIFDPFFTTNRKKGGSGLGLNIVYNIITGQFKGTIQASHNIDRGIIFMIRIPT